MAVFDLPLEINGIRYVVHLGMFLPLHQNAGEPCFTVSQVSNLPPLPPAAQVDEEFPEAYQLRDDELSELADHSPIIAAVYTARLLMEPRNNGQDIWMDAYRTAVEACGFPATWTLLAA